MAQVTCITATLPLSVSWQLQQLRHHPNCQEWSVSTGVCLGNTLGTTSLLVVKATLPLSVSWQLQQLRHHPNCQEWSFSTRVCLGNTLGTTSVLVAVSDDMKLVLVLLSAL